MNGETHTHLIPSNNFVNNNQKKHYSNEKRHNSIQTILTGGQLSEDLCIFSKGELLPLAEQNEEVLEFPILIANNRDTTIKKYGSFDVLLNNKKILTQINCGNSNNKKIITEELALYWVGHYY